MVQQQELPAEQILTPDAGSAALFVRMAGMMREGEDKGLQSASYTADAGGVGQFTQTRIGNALTSSTHDLSCLILPNF